jgi:hemoglobin
MQENPGNEASQAEVEGLASSRRELLLQGAALLPATAAAALLASTPAAAQPARRPAASGQKSLYERLGGIFAIAGVVDYFSDEIVKDPVAGASSSNPRLREWHTQQLGRLPGLKFMRTLWVAAVSGGPFKYTATRRGQTPLGLEAAHRDLRISPAEFDAVAAVLSRSLDHFSVPAREKSEVLAAFAAHKSEVTQGWREAQGSR